MKRELENVVSREHSLGGLFAAATRLALEALEKLKHVKDVDCIANAEEPVETDVVSKISFGISIYVSKNDEGKKADVCITHVLDLRDYWEAARQVAKEFEDEHALGALRTLVTNLAEALSFLDKAAKMGASVSLDVDESGSYYFIVLERCEDASLGIEEVSRRLSSWVKQLEEGANQVHN